MNFEDMWSGARQFKDFERDMPMPLTGILTSSGWTLTSFRKMSFYCWSWVVQLQAVVKAFTERLIVITRVIFRMQALGSSGRKKDSLSRARSFLSWAHYFQAPATQATWVTAWTVFGKHSFLCVRLPNRGNANYGWSLHLYNLKLIYILRFCTNNRWKHLVQIKRFASRYVQILLLFSIY